MPRKMKDREDMPSKLPSRMESIPGSVEAPKKRERRTGHPDFEQMMQDMRIEEGEEQTSKVESLREGIETSEAETLSKELREFQNQASDLQAKLESDGIGPDMFTLDEETEFSQRLRSKSRPNATGMKKFWGGLGAMLTGGPADTEYYEEMLDRYTKLRDIEGAIERRQARLDEINAPKRKSPRMRGGRMSSTTTVQGGIRGGAAVMTGGGGFDIAKDIKESYAIRGSTKKAKKAIEEVKPETENLEDTQAIIEQRESERISGRVAAQDFEGTTAEFEQSFGLEEKPAEIEVAKPVKKKKAKKVEPAPVEVTPQAEALSNQEKQAILRLDQMAKGLNKFRLEIGDIATNEAALLENKADFEDRVKEYERGIESVIESNLDSTSDELYENVVAAQEALKDVKESMRTVYSIIEEDARTAGKGQRVMGMVRSGSRVSGAKTFGATAMDRAGTMQPKTEAPEVSEEAWQKQIARHRANYEASQRAYDLAMVDEDVKRGEMEAFAKKIKAEEEPVKAKKPVDRKREYAKQIKAAEVVEAERSGQTVESVSEMKDPFAERQDYYAKNAELMKWAIESKNFNAAELWENTNAAIESLDNYDRSELSTILRNAPDLAAAYVLEVAKVRRGDESGRGAVIRANLVLNLPPETNIERSVFVDDAYQEDIKKAAKRNKKKSAS